MRKCLETVPDSLGALTSLEALILELGVHIPHQSPNIHGPLVQSSHVMDTGLRSVAVIARVCQAAGCVGVTNLAGSCDLMVVDCNFWDHAAFWDWGEYELDRRNLKEWLVVEAYIWLWGLTRCRKD